MANWKCVRLFGMFCGNLVCSMGIKYILWPFGMFYGHLVCSMAIWYVLWPFGMFYGHLVMLCTFCTVSTHLIIRKTRLYFAPRGKLCPLGPGWSYPLGVKFSVRPSILLNSRECLPLGSRGEIKNVPQVTHFAVRYLALRLTTFLLAYLAHHT
jgi:hypothetical protein